MTAASRRFAHDLVDLLFDHVEQIESRPVVEWTPLAELRELVRIDGATATPLELARLVARYSNQLHHPSYMGHQVCPPLLDSATADLLISFTNNSTAVWEMSPIATVIEKEIVRWLADLAGYPDTAEGTAVSGGSAANLTGLMAARARWNADASSVGKRPIVIASADAHYSIARAAAIMGIPAADVVKVADGRRASDGRRRARRNARRDRGARGRGRAGDRRHRGLDGHRRVRSPRRDRAAARPLPHLAARRRRARRVGAAERPRSRISCAASSAPTRSRGTRTR